MGNFSVIRDSEDNFVEIVDYPNEIIEMYLTDQQFSEIIALEELAKGIAKEHVQASPEMKIEHQLRQSESNPVAFLAAILVMIVACFVLTSLII